MMVFKVTKLFVPLYVALFLPRTVSSLRCYHCLSSTSMADCSKTSTKLTCPQVSDSCAKISTEVTSEYFALKSYSYGCATKKMCEDAKEELKACKNMTQRGYQAKCDITCCSGDLCSPLVVSLSVTLVPSYLLVLPGVIFTLTSYFKLF